MQAKKMPDVARKKKGISIFSSIKGIDLECKINQNDKQKIIFLFGKGSLRSVHTMFKLIIWD